MPTASSSLHLPCCSGLLLRSYGCAAALLGFDSGSKRSFSVELPYACSDHANYVMPSEPYLDFVSLPCSLFRKGSFAILRMY